MPYLVFVLENEHLNKLQTWVGVDAQDKKKEEDGELGVFSAT